MPARQPKQVDELEAMLAVFIAKANVSLNAVHQSNLRSLLVAVFQAGWYAGMEALQPGSPRPNIDAAVVKHVPSCDRARLSIALQHVNTRGRGELLAIFKQYHYVGLSIDGVSIKRRKFLNIDVVCALSDTLPFTYDFLMHNSFTTAAFVRRLAEMLRRLNDDGLRVCGITTDGCRWQMNALDWRNRKSIQSRYPRFAKLLRVPCACHRLQLALTDLFKRNAVYHDVIEQVHAVAKILRIPSIEERLDKLCPAHCPTRWAYDFYIVGYIVERFALVRDMVADRMELDERIPCFLPLLEGAFRTIGEFEADDAPLSCVYPGARHLEHFLDTQSADMSEEIRGAYKLFARRLRARLLETCGCLFQLAYALSPKGREDLRREQLEQTAPPPPPPPPDPHTEDEDSEDDGDEEEEEDPMTRRGRAAAAAVAQVVREVRVHPPVFGQFSDSDDGDLLQGASDEEVHDSDYAPDGHDSEDADEGGPDPDDLDQGRLDPYDADQDGSDSEGGEEDGDEDPDAIRPESVEEAPPPPIPFYDRFDHIPSLFEQAEAGLWEVLHQYSRAHPPETEEFYISEDQAELVMGAFQEFANAAPSDLRLKPSGDDASPRRYNWTWPAPGGDGWRILTDIARRVEALVCNEAVSERTNSAMKRLIAPFRLKMGHGVLLSRLTLSRHGAPGGPRPPAANT
jgi:hypothetical protein